MRLPVIVEHKLINLFLAPPFFLQLELTTDFQAVPFEIIPAEIVQIQIYSWKHAIPVCHGWNDVCIEVLVHKLYPQHILITKILSDNSPAIIIEPNFPTHLNFIHLEGRSVKIDLDVIGLHGRNLIGHITDRVTIITC